MKFDEDGFVICDPEAHRSIEKIQKRIRREVRIMPPEIREHEDDLVFAMSVLLANCGVYCDPVTFQPGYDMDNDPRFDYMAALVCAWIGLTGSYFEFPDGKSMPEFMRAGLMSLKNYKIASMSNELHYVIEMLANVLDVPKDKIAAWNEAGLEIEIWDEDANRDLDCEGELDVLAEASMWSIPFEFFEPPERMSTRRLREKSKAEQGKTPEKARSN